MGVPGLYGWLARRYGPLIVRPVRSASLVGARALPAAVEAEGGAGSGDRAPQGAAAAAADAAAEGAAGARGGERGAPRGFAARGAERGHVCDELYVDFNFVAHYCTHPDWREEPHADENEPMVEMEAYLARLVEAVRPRRRLMIAIDGVPPLAKVVQQRERRYTAALRHATERDAEVLLRDEMGEHGDNQGEPPPLHTFDTCVITPGTGFMEHMEAHLRRHLAEKAAGEWGHLEIIFSGMREPGEGEHKIMQVIRAQREVLRARADEHGAPSDGAGGIVMVGNDADLILLGLTTHDPRMRIVRDQFIKKKQLPRMERKVQEALRLAAGKQPEGVTRIQNLPFESFDLGALRACLYHEYDFLFDGGEEGEGAGFDFERVLDDMVFLTFIAGNDFTPSTPCMSYYEKPSSTDVLWNTYAKILPELGGYITHRGEIEDTKRLATLLHALADGEMQRLETFRKMAELRAKRMAKAKESGSRGGGEGGGRGRLARRVSHYDEQAGPATDVPNPQELRSELRARIGEVVDSVFAPSRDRLALAKAGDHERWYQGRVGVKGREGDRVANEFIRGLAWTLAYYHRGPGSDTGAPWRWGYPYDDAPLMRDLPAAAAAARDFLEPEERVRRAAVEAAAAEARRGELRAQRRLKRSGGSGDAVPDPSAHPYDSQEAQEQQEQQEDRAKRLAEVEAREADAALREGPLSVSVALLSVIPPESAEACLAARADCQAAMSAILSQGEEGESRFFPPHTLTRQWLDTERSRFPWQSKVRLESPDIGWIRELEKATAEAGGGRGVEGEECRTEAATVVYYGQGGAAYEAACAALPSATSAMALAAGDSQLLQNTDSRPDVSWGTFDLWRAAAPFGDGLAVGAEQGCSPGDPVPIEAFKRLRKENERLAHKQARRKYNPKAAGHASGKRHSADA